MGSSPSEQDIERMNQWSQDLHDACDEFVAKYKTEVPDADPRKIAESFLLHKLSACFVLLENISEKVWYLEKRVFTTEELMGGRFDFARKGRSPGERK